MQCFEFELIRNAMRRKLSEADPRASARYDDVELAEILESHGISSIDQLPDVVTLARNLQFGVRLVA